MATRFIFFFIFFSGSTFTNSAFNEDEYKKKIEHAESLYKGGHYSEALPVYLELYREDSVNGNVCYKIGACYLKYGRQHKNAVAFLKKAVNVVAADYDENNLRELRAPLKTLKFLGDAYHLSYEFDLAINSYKKYTQTLISYKLADKDNLKELARKIEMCNTAKELMANVAEVEIINMGSEINSVYADYSPRLSADQRTMIFTSRRPENCGGNTYDGGQYFEDIYISTKSDSKWSNAANIGWPINTSGNEAAIGISADGQEILIYKEDMGNGNIYSSCLDGDKWLTPYKLNSNVNSDWWEPCAFLSADGNTLFFVSDRPGGYGGTDIYKSKKQADGDWGKAINLGPTVNSPYDEYSPFMHPDGITLFFSSEGHKTMGGFDIFYSRTLLSDENAWLEPTNIGYPVNSTGDDAFYMVSPDKKTAYYSSYRDEGFGEKDNYMVIFPEPVKSPVALFKGRLVDNHNYAVKNGLITVTEKNTNEKEIHRANSSSGEYLMVLPPGSYNISYEGEGLLFYSVSQYVARENSYSEERKDVRLSGPDVGSRISLNNIYFDFDDSRLRPSSKTELDNLYRMLKQHPRLLVEVSGYADSRGSDEYNKKLSFERASAVTNYLVTKGIEKGRVLPVAMGEEVVENGGKENEGLRPSGRRVEFTILKLE